MMQTEPTAVVDEQDPKGPMESGAKDALRQRSETRGPRGGLFDQYKAEQGKATRVGTFVGLGIMIAWGAKYLYDQLSVYEDVEGWAGLLITSGIPMATMVLFGAVAWWFVFAHRASGDFMIATEGEMKKVSWSTKRELIGSTKVVIMFTVLLAALLFCIDLLFQTVFRWIGVLKA